MDQTPSTPSRDDDDDGPSVPQRASDEERPRPTRGRPKGRPRRQDMQRGIKREDATLALYERRTRTVTADMPVTEEVYGMGGGLSTNSKYLSMSSDLLARDVLHVSGIVFAESNPKPSKLVCLGRHHVASVFENGAIHVVHFGDETRGVCQGRVDSPDLQGETHTRIAIASVTPSHYLDIDSIYAGDVSGMHLNSAEDRRVASAFALGVVSDKPDGTRKLRICLGWWSGSKLMIHWINEFMFEGGDINTNPDLIVDEITLGELICDPSIYSTKTIPYGIVITARVKATGDPHLYLKTPDFSMKFISLPEHPKKVYCGPCGRCGCVLLTNGTVWKWEIVAVPSGYQPVVEQIGGVLEDVVVIDISGSGCEMIALGENSIIYEWNYHDAVYEPPSALLQYACPQPVEFTPYFKERISAANKLRWEYKVGSFRYLGGSRPAIFPSHYLRKDVREEAKKGSQDVFHLNRVSEYFKVRVGQLLAMDDENDLEECRQAEILYHYGRAEEQKFSQVWLTEGVTWALCKNNTWWCCRNNLHRPYQGAAMTVHNLYYLEELWETSETFKPQVYFSPTGCLITADYNARFCNGIRSLPPDRVENLRGSRVYTIGAGSDESDSNDGEQKRTYKKRKSDDSDGMVDVSDDDRDAKKAVKRRGRPRRPVGRPPLNR